MLSTCAQKEQGMSMKSFIVAVVAFASVAVAGHRSIVIVSGQSNARSQYADGVRIAIEASGRFESPVIYHRSHSGNRMTGWVTGVRGQYSPGENFTADFWAQDGSSGLQALIAGIESAGDTWSIEGFFWFQGESDTGSAQNTAEYRGRFAFMLNTIEDAYGLDRDLPFVITLIDSNGNSESLAAIGRTLDDIDMIREVQADIAASVPYGVAFDSRGWPRLDVWHVGSSTDPRGIYAVVRDLGGQQVHDFLNLPSPSSRSDLNGDGLLDLRDICRFIDLFVEGHPAADLAAPYGVIGLEDVSAFTDGWGD